MVPHPADWHVGVFMALDFFLFFVFWEAMLVSMYLLIGIWGGPRKLYAAIKFFLYTLEGSVLMLLVTSLGNSIIMRRRAHMEFSIWSCTRCAADSVS